MADHVHHAKAFRSILAALPSGRSLDLGSGGGVPGLVLARAQPDTAWVLLDATVRRTDFLVEAVSALGMDSHVQVVTGRAEDIARHPVHRGSYQLVVARSFGRPAVVAECGAPLLTVGGHLVVSEPPDGNGERRWPEDGLGALGLRLVTTTSVAPHLAILRQDRPCPERFPRRVGIPSKRPLW
ncbi:hypothetical protein BH24ACT1_BH24ACT1_04120 [soil metagenome]